MRFRLESLIVGTKVFLVVAALCYACFCWGGIWMTQDSKWSLYACFLTVSLGLDMSLLLRRTREGLAKRFDEYSREQLLECCVLQGKGLLTEHMVLFLGECSQILSRRFTSVTKSSGHVLAVLGGIFAFPIVGMFIFGVPVWFEQYLVFMAFPGLLYYTFLALVYCDVIVQMDGVCIDVKSMAKEIGDMMVVLPDIAKIAALIKA